MKSHLQIYILLLMLILCAPGSAQSITDLAKYSKSGNSVIVQGPNRITRNVIQDKKGNIWIAAFDGIFRYDGKSFTNITKKVTSSRFFSVLEDRKGNFWFGSIGSGVYYYNGKTFRNFTTKDGLAGNAVGCIYEDKAGNIWLGTGGGASRYDGKSFRNFTTRDGLPDNDVNAIVEDNTGKFWFGTSGNTCVYDGKTFTVLTHTGKTFTNVRSIIEDRKDNIWLGGNNGLWRYNGKTFTNLTPNFVGYIYEDKKGNIWTSSIRPINQGWALSRYDEKSLYNLKPMVTEITPDKGMICGILEANDGSIWFGASAGVFRYDGSTIADLKSP